MNGCHIWYVEWMDVTCDNEWMNVTYDDDILPFLLVWSLCFSFKIDTAQKSQTRSAIFESPLVCNKVNQKIKNIHITSQINWLMIMIKVINIMISTWIHHSIHWFYVISAVSYIYVYIYMKSIYVICILIINIIHTTYLTWASVQNNLHKHKNHNSYNDNYDNVNYPMNKNISYTH